MPSYKLTYFDLPGRGEEIRLLFALAKQDFEDKRIEKEDWPALKPKTPMGGLPLLEYDGVTIAQSQAIARFVARQFGFAGKSDFESAQVDMIADTITDVGDGATKVGKAPEDQKEEAMKKFLEEGLPSGLQKLEKLLGDKQWFVGDSITWADVRLFSIFSVLLPSFKFPIPWDAAPKCKKLADKVAQIPEIKEWREKHP